LKVYNFSFIIYIKTKGEKMKKIVLFVLFVLLFVGLASSQTEIILGDLGNGNAYVRDSLYYVYIDTSATPDDTLSAVQSVFFANKGNWEWMYITLQDTGTTYDDTIKIKGTSAYSSKWNDAIVRDSAYAVGQPDIDDASIHSYTVWIKPLYKVGIFLTNTAIDTGHVHYFDFQLTK